jgi:hypothetical protein
MNSDGKVGGNLANTQIGDGNIVTIRTHREGNVIVQDGHARYQEPNLRGNMFSLTTPIAGVTVAAANVIGGTNAQPIVGVFNPVGSNKNVVITRAACSVNSGTLGTGGFVWGYALNSTATISGVSGQGEINLSTFLTGNSAIRTYINTAATGATSILLRHIGGPTVGAAAANANLTILEETAGDIVVPPGVLVGIFMAAAGTSPIVNVSMVFEVIPV